MGDEERSSELEDFLEVDLTKCSFRGKIIFFSAWLGDNIPQLRRYTNILINYLEPKRNYT